MRPAVVSDVARELGRRLSGLPAAVTEAVGTRAVALSAEHVDDKANSARFRDASVDDLRRKLNSTVEERTALDVRIGELQKELRFCQASRQALLEMEVWLLNAVADGEAAARNAANGGEAGGSSLQDIGDFLGDIDTSFDVASGAVATDCTAGRSSDEAGRPPLAPPTLSSSLIPSRAALSSHLQALTSIPSVWAAAKTAEGRAAVAYHSGGTSWHENVGKDTATCHNCGMRLPLDPELIEMHAKECDNRLERSPRVPREMC